MPILFPMDHPGERQYPGRRCLPVVAVRHPENSLIELLPKNTCLNIVRGPKNGLYVPKNANAVHPIMATLSTQQCPSVPDNAAPLIVGYT